ncbi:unnamed protein product [Calicophoron daubneyi]|uniref:Steroid dehydrogenase n=1 Tax=Calicophoron daubneyi TaxID=300641 RepID=A0AAV2T5C5_CALDB
MLSVLAWIFIAATFWWVVFPLLVIFYRYTIGQRLFSRRRRLRDAGEWAIVTGATDGIGKGFVQELASDGLNIVLISRNAEKLDVVAEEIRTGYGVSVKCIQADFTKLDIYEKIGKEISSLPSIACLINNVGITNLNPFCTGMRMEDIQNMIACNTISMASMTHLVLPQLLKQNSGAAIINLSSYAGCEIIPYLAVYGATKAFVKHLTVSLALEMNDKNLLIQAACPLRVSTAMTDNRRGYFIITPRDCAASILNQLGVGIVTVGHIRHAIQIFLLSFARPIIAKVIEQRYKEKLMAKKEH